MLIRMMDAADYPQVARILQEGIDTPNVTFRTQAPEWPEWHAGHCPNPRLVAETESGIVGWIALSPISTRACYRGVGEISLYVARHARGHGVGRALLTAAVAASEREGFWTLEAHIFEENTHSIHLHTACGFRQVGVRERLGQDTMGVWHNVVLMERRKP